MERDKFMNPEEALEFDYISSLYGLVVILNNCLQCGNLSNPRPI